MKYKFGKEIVIAFGGSIIFPDNIDWIFLRKFKKFLTPLLKERKFIIVTGGGKLSRFYQTAASKIIKITDEDKDWLGVHATRLNAHLLRTIFRDEADPIVIKGRNKIKKPTHALTIASGWRPGWSSDYVAMQIAADLGIKSVIIAGKPDYVYDKDNAKYKTAKPFLDLTWQDYKKLIPATWKPGLHAPVDPIAANLAVKESMDAVIINGRDLTNFKNLIQGKDFKGTIISATIGN